MSFVDDPLSQDNCDVLTFYGQQYMMTVPVNWCKSVIRQRLGLTLITIR